MAQILVRQLEDDVKAKIQRRARRNGRSTEEEVREILRNAVRAEDQEPGGLGTRIAARFKDIGLEPHEQFEEFRGEARPAEFEQ